MTGGGGVWFTRSGPLIDMILKLRRDAAAHGFSFLSNSVSSFLLYPILWPVSQLYSTMYYLAVYDTMHHAMYDLVPYLESFAFQKNTELDVDTQEVNNVDGSAPRHARVKF